MIKEESIFTNLDEIKDEDILEVEEEQVNDELVMAVTLPDLDDAIANSKLDKLKDMVGVKKETQYFEVMPTINVPTTVTGALTRPTSLDHIINCPRCNTLLKSAIAINGAESTCFKECTSCGTLINTWRPIKYQAEYAVRRERYTMLAGGFGSGKSAIHIHKIIQHLIIIPNSRVVVAAKTYPALEATFVKDFFSVMPVRLLRKKNEQKREWVFTNGSELMLRSFDDETKLRGINATLFVLLEASNIQYEGFELAQNRIRNSAALIPETDSRGLPVYRWDEQARMNRPVYKYDARKIMIETNPDAGWVKKKFLLDSHEVSYYGSAYREGYRMNDKCDPNKFTLVMATDANPYLPENFIQEQTRGKSVAYVQQFFYGSFNFSENAVYPNIGGRIVKPHPLPPEFDEQGRRALWYLIGLDYGVSDPLAVVYAAFSTITKKIYFFDEIYERGLSVKAAVAKHRAKMKLHNITNDKLLSLPLFDGRSYNKRESNLKTIGSMFNEEGLYFKPSFTMIDARIVRFNDIIDSEQIEIFSNMEFFIEEAIGYKKKLNKDGTPSNEPVDKNNHAINAGEFIIMELPLNLNNLVLSAYIPPGTLHKHDINMDNQKVQKVFNPYEGGSIDARGNTSNTNNLYGSNNRRNVRHSRVVAEGEQEENLFAAYVPRRTK